MAQQVHIGAEPADASPSPVFRKRGMRCASCDRPFRTDLPEQCPVPVWVAAVKAVRCPYCGSAKILAGEGRSVFEDDAARGVPQEASLAERAADWLATGETGSSSETIVNYMTGKPAEPACHPSDPDDLRRCLLLLRRLPEWVPRMPEMAALSAEWRALVDAWPALTALFIEEVGPQMRGAAPKTDAMMTEILEA